MSIQANRPSDFAATYSTSMSDLELALESKGIEAIEIMEVEFTGDYHCPIWHGGSIVAHQTGVIAVAKISDLVYLGLRRGSLDAIAAFRIETVRHLGLQNK